MLRASIHISQYGDWIEKPLGPQLSTPQDDASVHINDRVDKLGVCPSDRRYCRLISSCANTKYGVDLVLLLILQPTYFARLTSPGYD